MQLIVKVTGRCNFKCSFCSANLLGKHVDLPLSKLISFVTQYQDKVTSIVFEGGDPLCVDPEYYSQFFKWKDSNPTLSKTQVSITTNLWDFYKHPDKWIELFNRNDVEVGTSFQYGDGRRLSASKIYTEDVFIDVYNKFVSMFNKHLGFIAVINNDNEHTIEQTALLAKRLDTVCKINPQFYSGRSSSFYRWDQMMLNYALLFEKQLDQYEINCQMIRSIISGQPSDVGCPFHSRSCVNDFRTINPSGEIESCCIVQNATTNIKDKDSSIVRFYRNSNIQQFKPHRDIADIKCLTCGCFRWCNNCRIKILEYKHYHDCAYCRNIQTAINKITKLVMMEE